METAVFTAWSLTTTVINYTFVRPLLPRAVVTRRHPTVFTLCTFGGTLAYMLGLTLIIGGSDYERLITPIYAMWVGIVHNVLAHLTPMWRLHVGGSGVRLMEAESLIIFGMFWGALYGATWGQAVLFLWGLIGKAVDIADAQQ
jgi:hypothetical protein